MQSQKEAELFKEGPEELQMHLFGRSTERMECLGQESIFNEAEAKYSEKGNESEIEKAVVVHPKKPRGKLAKDLKELPAQKEMHELSEDELQRIFGEKGWKRLPYEVSWKLEYHPSVKEAAKHHTTVYASKNDDRIVRAPRPGRSACAQHSDAVFGCGNHERKVHQRHASIPPQLGIWPGGVNLSVPTMVNWVIRYAERCLQPVHDKLHEA